MFEIDVSYKIVFPWFILYLQLDILHNEFSNISCRESSLDHYDHTPGIDCWTAKSAQSIMKVCLLFFFFGSKFDSSQIKLDTLCKTLHISNIKYIFEQLYTMYSGLSFVIKLKHLKIPKATKLRPHLLKNHILAHRKYPISNITLPIFPNPLPLVLD